MKKWMTGISTLLLGMDLFGKYLTEKKADDGKETQILGGKVVLRKVHNDGFALNLLSGEEKIVKSGALVAGILLFGCYVKEWISGKRKGMFAGISLMLSGAISNLFDRFQRGYVVDYIGFPDLDSKFKKLTFNIGDFLLIGGAVLVGTATAIREVRNEIKKRNPLSAHK